MVSRQWIDTLTKDTNTKNTLKTIGIYIYILSDWLSCVKYIDVVWWNNLATSQSRRCRHQSAIFEFVHCPPYRLLRRSGPATSNNDEQYTLLAIHNKCFHTNIHTIVISNLWYNLKIYVLQNVSKIGEMP